MPSRRQIPVKIREGMFKKYGHICQVCGRRDHKAHAGHIIDVAVGGENTAENLLPMCWVCNMMKPFHHSREEFDAWVQAEAWWDFYPALLDEMAAMIPLVDHPFITKAMNAKTPEAQDLLMRDFALIQTILMLLQQAYEEGSDFMAMRAVIILQKIPNGLWYKADMGKDYESEEAS